MGTVYAYVILLVKVLRTYQLYFSRIWLQLPYMFMAQLHEIAPVLTLR